MIHQPRNLNDIIFRFRKKGSVGSGNNNTRKRKVEEIVVDDNVSTSSEHSSLSKRYVC